MKLFQEDNQTRNADTRRIYALFELAYTTVDFLAAICFPIGSILFFWPAYETPAVWFFVVGSVCFCLKPTIRLSREIKLARMGDTEDLAERLDP